MNQHRRRAKPRLPMARIGQGQFIGMKARKAILQRMKIRGI